MALTRYEGSENQGGVCQMRILKRCDFEINQVIIERYRGKTGFIKISANDTLENVFPINYFTHFVAEHKQPSSRSQHGHYNEQGFTFALSKDRPDILAQITQLQDEPLVVIFKNNNHDWKVIGTEEDWAMISAAQETGAHPSDINQYLFDVKCPSRYLSPFLEFEKREVVVPDPPAENCWESGEGVFHTSNRDKELRRIYTTPRFNRVGIYKVFYKLSFETRITVLDFQTRAVIDTRMANGEGSYTFPKGTQFMELIIAKIAASPNYVSIAPPCPVEI